MEVKKLTKGQRRRRNEQQRKDQAASWQRTMGQNPDHKRNAFRDIESNVGRVAHDPWERAPDHVVDKVECPSLNQATLRSMAQRAGEERSLARSDRIAEMERLYPDLFGARGKAKEVADRWNRDSDDSLSVRTVQEYFRAVRQKRKHQGCPD